MSLREGLSGRARPVQQGHRSPILIGRRKIYLSYFLFLKGVRAFLETVS